MVERLVYTEAAESSNPSPPMITRKRIGTKESVEGKTNRPPETKNLLGVWVAQVVEHQVEGLMVGSSNLPPDKERGEGKKTKEEGWD